MRLYAVLPAVIALLQRERKVTYWALKHDFDFDDGFLTLIRDELIFKGLARDEHGKGLVWLGELPPQTHPTVNTERVERPTASPLVTTTEPPTLPPIIPASENPVNGVPVSQPSPVVGSSRIEGSQFSAEQLLTSPQPDSVAPLHETQSNSETDTESRVAIAHSPIANLNRNAPAAERRQLTVMFCDLADSTKLSQQLDPEDLRAVIRSYQQTSAEVIQSFDGYIAQHLGDGLLIYFGWPQAHEDDAQRALHAGLGIVQAITATLNPRLKAEKSIELSVRLGIHTGPVVVGEMGGGGRSENLATGETVNIAARLEGLAHPNTVVISSVTERLARGAFALEDLGPQVLKGIAEPMGTFRVLGPMEVHEDETTAASVPFLVGRDEEVGLLLRRWEQSKEGLGQAVLISGEAGIGKSSLVTTIRHHVVQEGYTRMTFRCSPYHTNSALSPVIDHVQRVLQFQPGDTPATRLDKLEGVLTRYSRPLEEVVPLYAALLSVPVPEGRYAALNMSPQQQRQQTQEALVGWLLEEAERHPTLAVWEDLHWADPSTLDMLGLILEQTPTVPMLQVLTFRPEFLPPWPTRSHMTPITLNRLERPQVEALIKHLAQNKALPSEVIQHIVAKTDGVPLYVEELAKMLFESELLRGEDDQYTLTGPLTTIGIPDTLQDSLMARLDQLNTAKEVAQLGAVLGREFSYEMLQAISLQDEETLQEGLAQLVNAELLYQRERPPRAIYIFKHALIQDAAYTSLLRSTRQRVHQQIAQLLETHYPETVETQPELLAQHYTAGQCHQQAITYWQRAGQQAFQRSANQEAIHHATKGVELLHTLPHTLERDQQELDLQLIIAPALFATKGYASPEVLAVCHRMNDLCQQLGDTSKLLPALCGMWLSSLGQGDLSVTLTFAAQCLDVAQRQQEPSDLLIAHWSLAVTSFYRGEFAAAHQHAEQAIGYYDPAQHHAHAYLYGQDPGMTCLTFAAQALWMLGYPDQALDRGREALTVARQLAHPYSIAFALAQLAVLHQFRREAYAVCEQSEELMKLCSQEGFAGLRVMGMILQGWGLMAQGQEHEGMAQMYQNLDRDASSAGLGRAPVLTQLAEAHWKTGQNEEGLKTLDEASELIERTQERWWEAELYRLRGELWRPTTCGEQDAEIDPEDCFHKALDIARRQQAKSLELRAATSLARLWQQQGKCEDAHTLLSSTYHELTEGFDTADLQEAKALLDILGT